MSTARGRRLLLILLCLCLVFFSVLFAFAPEMGEGTSRRSLTLLRYNDSTIRIDGYGTLERSDYLALLKEAELSFNAIRNIILGTHFDKLGFNCFGGSAELQSVFLGEGILRIDAYALADCPKLRYLYLPAGLEHVDPKFALNDRIDHLYASVSAKTFKDILPEGFADQSFWIDRIPLRKISSKSIPYLRIEGSSLFRNDDAAIREDTVTVPHEYCQYGPYFTFSGGTYGVSVFGGDFSELLDSHIWVNAASLPESTHPRQIVITKQKISYMVSFPTQLDRVEFCVGNYVPFEEDADEEREYDDITVTHLELRELSYTPPAFLKYWAREGTD